MSNKIGVKFSNEHYYIVLDYDLFNYLSIVYFSIGFFFINNEY